MEINEKNFEEGVVKKSSKIPVLVDFYADWCFPCKVLSSTLEKIAKELEGKIIIAKVNVDEATTLAEKYQIMSIPNVKLFKNGKIVDEFLGALPEQEIKYWLKKWGIE